MDRIDVPIETWIELYADLSEYVEDKCYPKRKTHDEKGKRLQETQDYYFKIVGEVEEILYNYFEITSEQLK